MAWALQLTRPWGAARDHSEVWRVERTQQRQRQSPGACACERLSDGPELQCRPHGVLFWWGKPASVNYLIHMQSVTHNFSSAKGFSLHDLHHLFITTWSEGEEDPRLRRGP